MNKPRFTKVDGMDILHGKGLVEFIHYIVILNRDSKGVTVHCMVAGSHIC